MELAGRRAIVTGASSGIGLATAQALAGAGAWVAMVARTEDRLAEAAARAGGHPFAADVTSLEAVDRLMAQLAGAVGGPPDILINAAGSFALSAFYKTDPDTLESQLAANVRGPFLLIRASLPGMLACGAGHIVNVGSVAGTVAFPGNAAYSASKYGLRGLHEVLAVELRGTGIRLTLVDPAATDTGLWDAVDPDRRDDLPSRSEMLSPGDVARGILFAVTQPPGVEISHLAIRSIR